MVGVGVYMYYIIGGNFLANMKPKVADSRESL